MNDNVENNEVVETPVELTAGDMLRNARTTGRRKREIPTISKQLCIREEFLEALENGNYSVIPEPVYILGFARNYAMELGLDPDEIVEKIKKEMGMTAVCTSDDEDVSACAMPSIKEESWGKVTFVKAYQFVYQNWLWFLGALLAVVLIIVSVSLLTPEVQEQTPVEAPVETVVVEEKDKEPEYRQTVRERFGVDNRESANVVLQASQESWVKVEDGRGNTVFSRVLVPGDLYYVPKGDKYKATFGNAGGVDVWVNGKLIPDVGPDHTKKAGISLAPKNLLATKKE